MALVLVHEIPRETSKGFHCKLRVGWIEGMTQYSKVALFPGRGRGQFAAGRPENESLLFCLKICLTNRQTHLQSRTLRISLEYLENLRS